MRYSDLKPVVGFLFVAACGLANADTLGGLMADYEKVSTEGRTSHIVDIDNDTLLLNKDDGFYSSGLRYTRNFTLRGAAGETAFGWRIGQELYTASDIKLPPARVRPPNHPYAGWLYGGFFKEEHRADGSRARFGIDIGCLGPCAGGEWTQTTFHRLLRQPLPQGWGRQVRNELGVVLYADIAPVRWVPAASIDITPSVRGRFGNIFTDVGADVLVRAGRLNALPSESSFYGFMRANARAVGYNATLQGGYFSKNNPHTVEPKRFVGEAEIGVAWDNAPYGAKVTLVRRSNEIRSLRDSIGAQNFVRLQFSYTP